MFSQEVQITFSLAVREAQRRHHEYLTTEHVLYAMLFEENGQQIIRSCGGDPEVLRERLEEFFSRQMESLPGGEDYVPEQTIGLQRVLQRTVVHMHSAGKKEISIGDVLAAILEEQNSHAASFLVSQGLSRLDVLEFISHGVTKVPPTTHEEGPAAPQKEGEGRSGGAKSAPGRDPLAAFTVNLLERAAQGKIDPLIGRAGELQRTVQILCRRRKNNPIYVGEPGVGKTALAEGLALMIQRGEVPEVLADCQIFALDMGALLAGTKFRGDFEEINQAASTLQNQATPTMTRGRRATRPGPAQPGPQPSAPGR